jgi:hypothetical protein
MAKVNSVPRRAVRWNVALQIIAAFLIAGAVNFLSFNHYARWDFSRSQKFTLADQTKRLLRDLDNKPLHITVAFSPTSASLESQVAGDVQGLMKELVFSGRPNVQVEYVDTTRDATRARDLQARYKFSDAENVIILDYDGRVKFLPIADMAEFDMTPIQAGQPPVLTAFKGEQVMTNGLIALRNPERLAVYFLQGHGEPVLGSTGPISVFGDYFSKQNVKLSPVSLAGTDAIPKDSAALVIIAPQYDYSDIEIKILDAYWNAGGRLLVLLDPRARTPRLANFLGSKGIMPRDDRILRTIKLDPIHNTQGILRIVSGGFMDKNPVTRRLFGKEIVFPGESQSLFLDTKLAEESKIQVRPLIEAGELYWGETDYVTTPEKGVRYDEGHDTGYPVYVAASADRGGVADDRVQIESSKLVVVGSSEFALDTSMTRQSIGLDFLVSAMNWLLDRSQLTGVLPRNIKHFSLELTESQMSLLSVVIIVGIPAAAGFLGFVTWLRRRA